ncbi:MAG: cyclic nucleotide-binding domain-containing protein [Cyclobacteriaceae bacterium]|nr:cyclic nucleotide-binding domain-containing protein [Cyclobacteriaceae bacterium]
MINPFKKSYTSKELNTFRFLSRIPLFERLDYKEMSYFLPYFYLREYKMNEVVFFRNDPGNALYLVKSGKISVNIDIDEEFEQLSVIKSGESFGESALLTVSNRIYTAIVHSERAELYVLPKVNIHEIFEGHPVIKTKMMESLSVLYHTYMVNLFKGYKSSLGLFNLSQVFGG